MHVSTGGICSDVDSSIIWEEQASRPVLVKQLRDLQGAGWRHAFLGNLCFSLSNLGCLSVDITVEVCAGVFVVGPYEELGSMLLERRSRMLELHSTLHHIVRRHEMSRWYDRRIPGWSHRDLSELSHFLFEHEPRPAGIESVASITVLWRIEAGIAVSRSRLHTYAYMLGFRLRFQLSNLLSEDSMVGVESPAFSGIDEPLMNEMEAREWAVVVFETSRRRGWLEQETIERIEPFVQQWRQELWSSLLVFPRWIREGKLSFSHASEEKDVSQFDFSTYGLGVFSCSIELRDSEDGGILRVSWESEEYHPDGWWLSFCHPESMEILSQHFLGTERKGQDVVLTSQSLGFDPLLVPFRFMIYPG